MGRNGGIAPQFLTPALDGGEWSPSGTHRFTPHPLGKAPQISIVLEAGWVLERVWTL
jgi:hypothetical protein